jgi:zinc protease
MSDIVRAPTFPPAEIDRLRGESLVALQQQVDDPVAAASTVVSRELYGPRHPYGHTTAEVDAGLTATTREDLQRFHQLAFTPRTSALILSGDLTADQARALATEHFGSWSGTGTDPPPPGPPSPASERVFVVDLPGAPQTTLALAQPGISVTDPDATAMRVMNAVLGGGFTSRINVNLRERHGYTYGASSSLDLGRDVGLLTLQTNVSTESTAASIRELLNEVAAMRDAPVGAEELARAKDSLSLSLPADFATGTSTAAAVGQLYLANLPPDYYQDLPAAIARTDAEDVQAVARAHLQPEEMKVVAVGDPTQIDPQLTQLALGPVAYLNPDGTPLATG